MGLKLTQPVDRKLKVDEVDMSDPSAPQMVDLRDEREIDVYASEGRDSSAKPNVPEAMEEIESRILGQTPGAARKGILLQAPLTPIEDDDGRSAPAEASSDVSDENPSFFVDDEPVVCTSPTTASYDALRAAPLGSRRSSYSSEERIVFKPRTYRQPEPISTPIPPNPSVPAPDLKSDHYVPAVPLTRVFVSPRVMSRAEKKAAKRDKRSGGKNKRERGRRAEVIEGSDIDWGSDGPSRAIMRVEGMDEDESEAGEDDVEVMRDYLEGTLLNAKMEAEDASEDGEVDEEEIEEEVDRQIAMIADGGDDDITIEVKDDDAGTLEEKETLEEEDDDEEGQWESSSGNSGSSDLGDLRQVPKSTKKAVAVVEESDETESDRFAGKDNCDDTDWFVRNMQASPPPGTDCITSELYYRKL